MKTHLNQSSFLREFTDEFREDFNPAFFYRSDDDIITELQKVILSCQRDRYFMIKVESFEIKTGYEEILNELRKDEFLSNRAKDDKDNRYNYVNLKDSEIKLLIVNYYIRVYDGNPDNPDNTKRLRVLIEVPRIVDKYYFKIFGNIYSSMFQVVDGSTYNNTASANSKNQNVTCKTVFMAIRLYRYKKQLDTVSHGVIPCTFFLSRIFNKPVLIFIYFLARFGIYRTSEIFKVWDLRVSESYDPSDTSRVVAESHGIYVSLPKLIYDEDPVAQSLMYTIVNCIGKDADINNVFSTGYWMSVLGGQFGKRTERKGLSILDSFESIYDLATMCDIHLPYEDKDTMYTILLWAVREFSALRQKDIFDIAFKKLRYPDYIAALYAIKMSRGIFRIADSGKVTLDQIVKAINIYPDYLLKQITKDKLVNYQNAVNDLDAIHALKFTYKGVAGIGEETNNKGSSVPPAFRRVHPSHLGRVDLDTASPTDPGLTGMLCPYGELYGTSLSDYEEPNTWREKSDELLRQYKEMCGFQEAMLFKRELGFPIDNSRMALLDDAKDLFKSLMEPVVVIENELTRGMLYF